MQTDINERAAAAKADPALLNLFIQENESTILKMASSILGRYITKSDDEWSISLCAFSKAVSSYDSRKGSFPAYAQMIIKQDLIDEYRRQARFSAELSTAPYVMEGSAEPVEDPNHVLLAVARESMERSRDTGSLQDEIAALDQELSGMGIRFMELTECSPRQERTRDACALVIRWMIRDAEAVKSIRRSGQLPAARIRRETRASEKLLEHYRKYLIASVLILSGDYPLLQEYLRFVKQGKEGI